MNKTEMWVQIRKLDQQLAFHKERHANYYDRAYELAEERDRLRAALDEIEAHHVANNQRVGRPLECSHTLAIIRRARATSHPGKP
jgi:dsDNA-binding SOS-regulon protein